MTTSDLRPDWAKELTPIEYEFVEEYFVDFNSLKAMKRVSANSGSDQPLFPHKRFMTRPAVAAAIEHILHERSVGRVWIINELIKVAKGNLADFVAVNDGKVVVFDHGELEEKGVDLSVLSEVSSTITEFGTSIKVKLRDPDAALAKLMKAHRMEVQKTEISGPKGGPVEVETSTIDPRVSIMERLTMMKRNREGEQNGSDVPVS